MTSYVQALACNRPIICLLWRNQFFFEDKLRPLLKEMEENNLIFYDSKSLLKFIELNYKDIDKWWYSKKITKTRKKLNQLFINNNKLSNLIKNIKT